MASSTIAVRPDRSTAAARLARRLPRLAPYAAVAAVALLVAWPSLGRREIDDLDQAHHLMGGLFFADFFRDLPLLNPVEYTLDYYSQYPALGFVFWPPLLDLVAGIMILVTGFHVVVFRIAILLFGLALACLMYATGRERLGTGLAVMTVAAALTNPILVWLYNSLLLEVPALALAFLTVFLYQRLVRRGHWRNMGEVVLLAVAGAAAVHAKQTIVFVFVALLIDLCVNHRPLLRSPKTWLAAGLLVLLCLPLAWFTLNYGQANLSQSFGDHGDIYTPHTKRAPRWSFDGWTYYAGVIAWTVHPVLVGTALLGLAAGLFRRRDMLRGNVIWLAWIGLWYLLFSYFDNKDPRFVAFAIPAVTVLAGRFLAELSEGSRWLRVGAYCLLAAPLVAQLPAAAEYRPTGFTGMPRIIQRLMEEDGKGNVAYFGNYRQMFVPFVRAYDPEREVYVLQGDDITEASGSVAQACHDYRVRWVLLDAPPTGKLYGSDIEEQVGLDPRFHWVRLEAFGKPGFQIPLAVYEYRGPVAEQMSVVPLRSETLNLFYR